MLIFARLMRIVSLGACRLVRVQYGRLLLPIKPILLLLGGDRNLPNLAGPQEEATKRSMMEPDAPELGSCLWRRKILI